MTTSVVGAEQTLGYDFKDPSRLDLALRVADYATPEVELRRLEGLVQGLPFRARGRSRGGPSGPSRP